MQVLESKDEIVGQKSSITNQRKRWCGFAAVDRGLHTLLSTVAVDYTLGACAKGVGQRGGVDG
jgi:hypothetical protein